MKSTKTKFPIQQWPHFRPLKPSEVAKNGFPFCETYEVTSPVTLSRAVGYVKYLNGGNTFLRGQFTNYPKVLPSLYRTSHGGTVRAEIHQSFRKHLRDANLSIINQKREMHEDVKEALLQHYGFKTPWLDLVDNLWVALWFACTRTIPVHDGFRFHARNSSGLSDDKYVYVMLLKCDGLKPDPDQAGLSRSDRLLLVNFRDAVPSHIVRPHCQHALAVRSIIEKETDLSHYVEVAFAVPFKLALDWLGTGQLVSETTLFPSPDQDDGYRLLLDEQSKNPKLIHPHYGRIERVYP